MANTAGASLLALISDQNTTGQAGNTIEDVRAPSSSSSSSSSSSRFCPPPFISRTPPPYTSSSSSSSSSNRPKAAGAVLASLLGVTGQKRVRVVGKNRMARGPDGTKGFAPGRGRDCKGTSELQKHAQKENTHTHVQTQGAAGVPSKDTQSKDTQNTHKVPAPVSVTAERNNAGSFLLGLLQASPQGGKQQGTSSSSSSNSSSSSSSSGSGDVSQTAGDLVPPAAVPADQRHLYDSVFVPSAEDSDEELVFLRKR